MNASMEAQTPDFQRIAKILNANYHAFMAKKVMELCIIFLDLSYTPLLRKKQLELSDTSMCSKKTTYRKNTATNAISPYTGYCFLETSIIVISLQYYAGFN
jgi:hypothetical protein